MTYFIRKVSENTAEMLTVPREDFGRDKMKKMESCAPAHTGAETGLCLVPGGPGLGAHTEPQGHSPERGLRLLPPGLALSTAEGTSPGCPPTCPCWWHLLGCRGVVSHAGEMRCPLPARQTA